jgi:hypothetical protein
MANPNPSPKTRLQKGQSGNPATQFQPGQTGNPGGKTRLQREYEAFQDRLFDPRARDAAFDILTRALEKHEIWACNRWFDIALKVLPQAPIELNVQADLSVARKEADAQREFIIEQLAKYGITRAAERDSIKVEPGTTPVRLALLGTPEPTGTER